MQKYKCYEAYAVGREERENHAGKQKAVLYVFRNGEKEKINVWKPGFKEPKIPKSSMPGVPVEIWEAFENEKEAIHKEELALS